MTTLLKLTGLFLLTTATAFQGHSMISVGKLSKEGAKDLGISMKQRINGDAGVKVWIEFKKEGFMENLTCCDFQMKNEDGGHLVSARLQPHPVIHGQSQDLIAFSFSAVPAQLKHCAFMIVAYGSTRGDVGHVLNVKDFLDVDELVKNVD